MNIEQLPSRTLYGIEVQTSNRTFEDIARLWQRFNAGNLADEIPERADDKLIAAYCDYEDGHAQKYTYFLGCEVIDVACAPEEFALRVIPAGNYAVFSAIGAMPAALVETWKRIWDADLHRTYVVDFEVHDSRSLNTVSIYIGTQESPQMA